MKRRIYCWCPGCGNVQRLARAHYRLFMADDVETWQCGWNCFADESMADEMVANIKEAAREVTHGTTP
jgi:hypothetical protein